MRKIIEPVYSGDLSKNFWKVINKLPEPERSEMYFAGVLLQNMESTIIQVLNNTVLRVKLNKKRRK